MLSNRDDYAPRLRGMFYQLMGARNLIQRDNLCDVESPPACFKCLVDVASRFDLCFRGHSPDYNQCDVVIGEGVPPLTASPEALRGADDSYSDCSGPGASMPPKSRSKTSITERFGYNHKTEADSYFASCIAILRPIRWRVTVSGIFAITALTVYVKWTVAGSSWIYAAVNAAMIAIGTGLAILSTARIVHDHLKGSSDDVCREPSNARQNPIELRKHQEGKN
jgi:hypothetical protein